MTFSEEGTQDRLDEILDLTKENNRILRKMHRGLLWSQFFTFLYWLVILGAAGWSYYYFQPHIEKYISAYQSIVENLNALEEQSKSFPGDIQSILDKVK